ncbi:indole-3-glycerol phosphate synthase [Methanocorpusculum labreanum Z]|uniref:indole-3-glycerol-phosphate synthase n=1 Tax=Methanocorpusculum labreanum (strain ATCC 43576 / DSM 4855 / Z) TaxID=410358 RepID=A2STA6_METLZ|nr:indole-3-glycerol-phosphate synthase [Methanocorpusculum labreanum]ABN07562.1 indole-3-glycerol phosphate synthase [Methanocorpusculum labreanum Z]
MILDDICARSRERAALLDPSIRKTSEETTYVPQSLIKSVKNCQGRKNAVIAEIKYKTPSDKTLDSRRDPANLSRLYESGGACAVSVLTEPFYFSGSAENLTKAKSGTRLPILRKDFIVDEKQIYETYVMQADSVLLIADVLQDRLEEFILLCQSLHLEPLVEVRNREDAENAVKSGALLTGINNRNLHDMSVDTKTTEELSCLLRDAGLTVISESGIKTPEDVLGLKNLCDGFLIGTSLMKSADPQKTLEAFVCV